MRSNVSPESAVAVLAAASLEAAWITLAYVMIGSLTSPAFAPLSILPFAGATLVGLLYARWSARHRRRSYVTPLALIVIAAAIIGWLLPLGPAVAQLPDDPVLVLGMHTGGLLLGLAVLRGTAHATPEDDERIAETALGPGLAVVAAIWVVLTATGATRQPSIVEPAFSATVTFVTAALLSIGLTRLMDLQRAGVRGADRRLWVGLLVGVVGGLLLVAMPLAMVLGVPLDHAVRGVLGPLADVLAAIIILLAWPAALLGMGLYLLIQFLQAISGRRISDPGQDIGGGLGDWQRLLGSAGSNGLPLGLVPILVAIVVAFLLMRMLLRRPSSSVADGGFVEVRDAERPTGGLRFRRPRVPMPRRGRVPRTASDAYLASLEVLERWPEAARRSSETPAEHARRLRGGPLGLPLGRLAADYSLAEFGQRTLAPSEHRRAIERWRRLRSRDR